MTSVNLTSSDLNTFPSVDSLTTMLRNILKDVIVDEFNSRFDLVLEYLDSLEMRIIRLDPYGQI